jgi:phosphoglycerate dehydrogenase-like enzyme
MTRVTILDDYQGVALDSVDWSRLGDGYELDVEREHIADVDRLVERLAESEIVVAMRERTAFRADTLARLPRLRLLITTGMVNAAFDLPAARERGITVAGTRSAYSPVPELTMGMILALTRHIAEEDQRMRAGGWQHTIGPSLAGSTLGIIGLGRQGIPVAALATAFQMDVVAWSPHLTQERADEHSVRAVTREQLFAESDVVTLHMPLTHTTRGLIGAADFAAMRPDAYFVNTSRGPIVDESALLDALTSGSIAGAALDVYDVEPLPADHPLRSAPNTLLLPHIGYVATQTYRVFYEDAVEDILAFAAGSPVRVIS